MTLICPQWNISLKDYYLAGGTALALQTGIRESFDFEGTPIVLQFKNRGE